MGGLIKSVGSSQRQIQSGLDGRIDGQTSGCRERLSVNRWPHWNSLMPLEFIDVGPPWRQYIRLRFVALVHALTIVLKRLVKLERWGAFNEFRLGSNSHGCCRCIIALAAIRRT